MAPIPNLDIHQHRAVARATGMLLWGWERPPHGTFEYRGHAMLHTLGFDPLVVQESAAFYASRCLGDSEARIAEAMRRMLAGEQGVEVEFALLDAKGQERWFLASGAFATAEQGIPVLAGWTHEITRRKQVEVALADSTRMLAAAERMAGLGSWRLRLADGVVEFSEQGAILLGLPVDAPVAPLDEISRRLDEDDRERVLALVTACAERGEAYTCTHRIHRPDGTVRLARSSGEPMRDSLGVIVAVAGSTLDITDEEEARQQLVMLGSAIENANDAVAVLETDYESEALPFSTIRFANPCLCRLLGRDHTTLVGERIRVLFGPDTDLAAIARVQVALHRGEPLTEEFTFGRPDGTTVRVDARLVPIGAPGTAARRLRRVAHRSAHREGARRRGLRGHVRRRRPRRRHARRTAPS
ncbi:MAG: PAS domain-containing protein [Gemmatimonadaceae bacterium]|nr:PAS domain-containing protein [Gemmatimonadaceae bacterium]